MLQKRLTCVSQLSHEDPSDSMASGSQQALFQNSHTGIRHIQNGVIVQQRKNSVCYSKSRIGYTQRQQITRFAIVASECRSRIIKAQHFFGVYCKHELIFVVLCLLYAYAGRETRVNSKSLT